MNLELRQLAKDYDLDSEGNFNLSLAFAIACVERVEHLLTDEAIQEAFNFGRRFLKNDCSFEDLQQTAAYAKQAATSHEGSNSLDGSGNAAVSVSHAVALALAGKAIEAAEYAAYAKVYSYSSSAVTDLSAYKSEFQWQEDKFRKLIEEFKKLKSLVLVLKVKSYIRFESGKLILNKRTLIHDSELSCTLKT